MEGYNTREIYDLITRMGCSFQEFVLIDFEGQPLFYHKVWNQDTINYYRTKGKVIEVLEE